MKWAHLMRSAGPDPSQAISRMVSKACKLLENRYLGYTKHPKCTKYMKGKPDAGQGTLIVGDNSVLAVVRAEDIIQT